MRSLFAKIFLWFWLATTLVATAAILAAVYTQGRPDISKPPFRNFVGEALAARGLLAVDALEHDGPTALRRHLERWERVTGGPTFLIDENGTEAIGRSLPQGAAALARHALETGTTQVDAASDYGLVATPVFGADERRYVVLRDMLPDGAGPPGFPQFHRAMRSLGPRRPPGPPPPMNPMDIALAQPGKLALMLGAVFLTGGILCYGLARYLTKPMRVLRTATTDLAGGDLTVRAGPSVSKRGDEIGQLGRDFDRMAERIESLISVERRLLRDISHELRSPLARLNVALGIARQHADGDTTGMLDRIETESERLEELIKQLLAITRIESGAQTILFRFAGGLTGPVVNLKRIFLRIVKLLHGPLGLQQEPLRAFQFLGPMQAPQLLQNGVPVTIRNPEQIRLFGMIVTDVFEAFIPHRPDPVVGLIMPVPTGVNILSRRPRLLPQKRLALDMPGDLHSGEG